MGKEHDKHADVDDKKKKGAEVDTDAEHNKDVSRQSSNADLKRFEKAKKTAGTANADAMSSAQTGLTFFAKEMHNWIPKLNEAMAMNTSTDAGAEPAIQDIQAIYDMALSDAHRMNEVLMTVATNERSLLGPDVGMVQGAAFVFLPYLTKAAGWMHSQPGYDQVPRLDVEQIRRIVDGYTQTIGVNAEIAQNRKAPEGDETAMLKHVIGEEVDALEAAINSEDLGNAEVPRITLHAQYLDNFAKRHSLALKSARPRLVAMKKKLDGIRAARGDTALDDASMHLASLIARHN